MRFQSTEASCGPAALRNALRSRGIERTEDELAQLCGFSPSNGTPATNMVKALKLVAADTPTLQPVVFRESRADVALLKLKDACRSGFVVILCVDNGGHWVVFFGLLGERTYHVADSDNPELVLHYSASELIDRWRGAGRYPYFGIVV